MNKLRILKDAQRNKTAIGQFNFSDISQFKGIIFAAKKMKSSVILGTSEGEGKFLNLKLAAKLRDFAEEELGFPLILNLDHGKSFEKIKEAISAGYDMVHFDGSSLPLEKNIKETKKVVQYAKKRGVIVEAELGYLTGSSKLHNEIIKIKKADMTIPEDAKKFVEETKADALAVVIGNAHGIYSKMPHLDLERLNMIKRMIDEKAFLVLHGGSGISNSTIRKAIYFGITKININTEIRMAWKNGLERSLKKNKKEVAPYKIYKQSLKEVEKVVTKKIKLFS